ncbi:MAG: 4-alpha-glucanotransferase [Spirochaetes bacterium]|nr:4-alpha-glucanotransferase [Spirochaetota bacterium]
MEKRMLGTAVPLGALRKKNSAGVGEFPDLGDFALLCKKMNLGFIQLLPVNDTGYESSPYSSLSAFALHPLYLRVQDLDEYDADLVKGQLEEAQGRFDSAVRFSHYETLKAKMAILKAIFSKSKADILKKKSLADWIKLNAWVKEYSVYRRLKEVNGEKSWKDWEEYSQISAAEIESLWKDEKLKEEHFFWAWLQEACDRQFSAAAKAAAAAGIALKGDLPILMNEDSCDVWARPGIFDMGLSAGAPPDMYSPKGQNWGFPTYNWEEQEKDGFAWWKLRLEVAGKYYKAYRIDHVLGFFRIWASSRADNSATLGRYVPYTPVTSADFKALGYDQGRIQWVSRPHIFSGALLAALRSNWGAHYNETELANACSEAFSRALNRLNNEDIWLFKDEIKGEKDIELLNLHPAATGFLLDAWRNRIFIEYEKGKFSPVWYYRDSQAYLSFSEDEKKALEELLEKRREKSEKTWEAQGKKLLSVMAGASEMLPCAEDLGAVPPCVPKTLEKLKILGLRVTRWFRSWEAEGQPYIPFEEYPPLSVCTAAVHDSSTVREWWEREADQEQFSRFLGSPPLPRVYNPGVAWAVLSKTASARSDLRVFQIQDLLHLSNNWYAQDAASERINVPGTVNDFNWTYRLPASIEEIGADAEFVHKVSELAKIEPAAKGKKR